MRDEKVAGKSRETRERQKATGFLGIRMVELNRHFEDRPKKLSGNGKRKESDSDDEKIGNVRLQVDNEVTTETTR